jgi:S1-C subfamily serine protease
MSQKRSSALVDLSEAIAAVVSDARAYTVTVYGRRRLPATGIAWSNELVVTANHVVERDEEIEIGTNGETRVAATVAGRDPAGDIAVLRVVGADLSAAPRASEAAKAGQFVLGIGRAGGGNPVVSMGIINTAEAGLRVSRGRIIEPVIQSEIVMLPGFSGGPLLNPYGEVLGMNSSHLGRGSSLTVTTAALEPIVDALATHGRLRMGYIGVGAQAVGLSASQVAEAKLEREVGLVILSIDENGPAQQAGLLIGDILVSVNGAPVGAVDDLVDQLAGDLIGKSIPLMIVRGSQAQELHIAVGERG